MEDCKQQASDHLRFEIKNNHPVTVADYAASLESLADEYRRYLIAFESRADADSTQLFVKEIRKGSIVNDLYPVVSGVLPLLDTVSSILSYSEYLKSIFDWLIGSREEKPPIADEKKTLDNVVKIIEPTARDQGAQMNIGVLTINGDVTMNFGIDSVQANAAQNFARRFLGESKNTSSRDREGVVLHWYQTRNALRNKTGDKAKIESISPDPIKVLFASEELKSKMVLDEANPYQKAFVVDVSVETVNDKPVLYRITHLHDTLDIAS